MLINIQEDKTLKRYNRIDALIIEREELASLNDVVEVADILKTYMPAKFNNLDIYTIEGGCSVAFSFISESLAEELKYDYQALNAKVTSLMNDVERENESCIYDFIYNGKEHTYAFLRNIEEFKRRISLEPAEIIIAENRDGKARSMTFKDALKEIKDSAESSEEDYFDFLEMNNLKDSKENLQKYVKQILDFCKSMISCDGRCECSRVEYYLVNNSYIQKKWDELEDVPFNEQEYKPVLSEDWFIFDKGTEREDIWHWFDEYHSKGVFWLLYEYK